MLDRDVPPVAEEEAGGGAADAHPIIAEAVGAGRAAIVTTLTIRVGFTPHPWTTATALCSGMETTTGIRAAGLGRDSARPIIRRIRSRCPREKTPARAFLPSSTTCFSWRKFRKRHER